MIEELKILAKDQEQINYAVDLFTVQMDEDFENADVIGTILLNSWRCNFMI